MVTASKTTVLIDANMILGVLYLVSAFGGKGVCAVGINGTKNDSRTENNFIPIRIIRDPSRSCENSEWVRSSV